MAHSKSTNTYNRQNWEDSEFPILCQTCLGENPYLRMMREKYGKECKICTRPFTVFRWCPGPKARFKKTEVCQTCAKLKNVCQTCILDLQYGLPVEVRDKALKLTEKVPKSEVGREYHLQQVERSLADDPTKAYGALGKAQAPSDMLMRLARTTPYYKRNRPHICSFYVKGECRRGEECPYRHERPTDPDDPLSEQNIRDRFYGVNDPVAHKLMSKYDSIRQQQQEALEAAPAGSSGAVASTSTSGALDAGSTSDYPGRLIGSKLPGAPLPPVDPAPDTSGGIEPPPPGIPALPQLGAAYPSMDPARLGGFASGKR